MDKTLLERSEVDTLIALALGEDGVEHDLTSLALGDGAKRKTRATILAKKETVACGSPLVSKILKTAKIEAVNVSVMIEEGKTLSTKAPWIILEGTALDLLRTERTILNFLMRMCGVADYTRKVVEKLKGTETRLLHTRKTLPGHRFTDIYAALTGGAHPHRVSLSDAILVKENHLRVANHFQELQDGIARLKPQAKFVEIEVTNFVELKHFLMARPDRILLDNFKIDDIKKAVNAFSGAVQFEASGNITIDNAREYAETGVDFISMGALTHSSPAADLSMLFDFGAV